MFRIKPGPQHKTDEAMGAPDAGVCVGLPCSGHYMVWSLMNDVPQHKTPVFSEGYTTTMFPLSGGVMFLKLSLAVTNLSLL